MSDDKSKKDFRDRTRVNMEEPYEVAYWTKRWGISRDELAAAIKAAGSSSVNKIEEYLRKS